MCNNPKYFNNIKDARTGKLIPIPCHLCAGCRIDKRKWWERRITSEYIKYRSAFVTLTYDEKNLPYNEGGIYPTVRKNDIRLFIDRLRHRINKKEKIPKNCTKKWHYAACTEYGSARARPHIHLILLGVDWLNQMKDIRACWKLGICDIKPIKRGGIRYILKYIDTMQGKELNAKKYTDTGREIPKLLFSKGLGKDFIISQQENISKYGCAKIGNRFIPIAQYWKNKLTNWNEKTLENIENSRNSYTKQMDTQARNLGYDSYDSMIREMRKCKEYAQEKNLRKRKEAIDELYRHLNTQKLPAGSELILDYKEADLPKILDKRL